MSAPSAPKPVERGTITKKGIAADHPTWCPGCGDFAVLAAFFKTLEKLQFPQEKIVTLAGIGCSSRFPYFVNTHGGHFIHGRALPFATGVSLGRDDLHVFVFGGDGDGFSIGGNHLDHAGRKNIRLTYVIMDNFVYGLTKKQTSPTSPQGFRSKTDPTGAIDRPTNPMRKLLSSGATFVARTHASQIKHMMEMYERAISHDGFSVVECLSECVEFYKGSFDAAIPRKGGAFEVIDEEKHNVTDMSAALTLAEEAWPGKFGVYYHKPEPTKNELEKGLIDKARAKTKGTSDVDLLKQTFAALK